MRCLLLSAVIDRCHSAVSFHKIIQINILVPKWQGDFGKK
jgi:hypothetical protein